MSDPDVGVPDDLPWRDIVDGDADRGVVVFDAGLRADYANLAARSLLHDSDGVLMSSLREAVAAFRDRVERSPNAPPPGELLLAVDGGRPFRAALAHLPRPDGGWYVARISPPGQFAEPNVRRLQTRFRLTLREAQVAVDVARGLTNSEIAARLGIMEKTVKNSLMSVFAKCEVRNRVELALRAHDAPVGAPPPLG